MDKIIWLKIDGVKMPTPSGFSPTYSDFDSSSSTRSETGVLKREVIRKNVHSPSFDFILQTPDLRTLMTAIKPDKISVEYADPTSETGVTTISEAYAQATRTVKTVNPYYSDISKCWWSVSLTFIEY